MTSQDREASAAAIAAIKQHLTTCDRMGIYPKNQVLTVVRDVEQELDAPEANILKLHGLLVSLAVAVQTDTGHDAAEHTAKVSFAFLGLDLLRIRFQKLGHVC
jgi:hypothetical protein